MGQLDLGVSVLESPLVGAEGVRVEVQPGRVPGSVRFRFHMPSALRCDGMAYFSLPRPVGDLTQVELSHFDPVAHSYLPGKTVLGPEECPEGRALPGPILRYQVGDQWFQVAYEHGHDHPDSFLEFRFEGDRIVLRATKGHSYTSTTRECTSVWFQLVVAPDLVELQHRARRFLLEDVCATPESRTPFIFYNTWNHQERIKYLEGRPYLDDMHLERMLAEIDVAHAMGVEVFVIDTGWYGKTGDWEVALDRFPDGLQKIRARIEGFGMKLGLWFNPTVVARTSRVYQEHPEWAMNHPQPPSFYPVWETEESTGMCLASDYWEDYVETIVRLHRELGASYLKWDAIGQYGCGSPHHNHGTEADTDAQRWEAYGYESGRQLVRIVEAITARCPGMIVDFDMTERGRYFGLGFLSAGKFFLVNNGAYFHDFDIPKSHQREPETINVFFNPGPARPRVCRTGVRFDDVVPSILFLTHYLPDGPRLSQDNGIASLVLGGNGIWGDLLSLSKEDIATWREGLDQYKQVRDGVTRAFPRVVGFPGSSPEIHEKLDETGTGIVVFFCTAPGTYEHVTAATYEAPPSVTGAESWELLATGRLRLTMKLPRDGAGVVSVIPTAE